MADVREPEASYLKQHEIDDIVDPLTRPADQCRALRQMGFFVKEKPSGRPLVSRANFNAVMAGRQLEPSADPGAAPDAAALLGKMAGKGANYARGKKAKEQSARPA